MSVVDDEAIMAELRSVALEPSADVLARLNSLGFESIEILNWPHGLRGPAYGVLVKHAGREFQRTVVVDWPGHDVASGWRSLVWNAERTAERLGLVLP